MRPKLVCGSVKGIENIENAIQDALTIAVNEFKKKLKNWVWLRVPERTGNLCWGVSTSVNQSNEREYVVSAPVDYAVYVDAMNPPINWTKPGSVYHFYQKLKKVVPDTAMAVLAESLEKVGLDIR